MVLSIPLTSHVVQGRALDDSDEVQAESEEKAGTALEFFSRSSVDVGVVQGLKASIGKGSGPSMS